MQAVRAHAVLAFVLFVGGLEYINPSSSLIVGIGWLVAAAVNGLAAFTSWRVERMRNQRSSHRA